MRGDGRRIWCATLVAASIAPLACSGPAHDMDAPAGFVRYADKAGVALITADGVRLRSRETRNYPAADLAFWKDALARHLAARGYAPKADRCFKTKAGLDGCSAEFVVPHGAEDWVLSVTLFVVGERVVIVEAAGPFERWAKVEAGVAQALVTFVPAP